MQTILGTAQILPAGDDAIFTGFMGDCVSVVVAYNRLNNGHFNNMRGFHGLGGIGAVNFPDLLAGVPDNATTHIFIIPGTLNTATPYLGLTNALDTIRTTLPNATIIQIDACGSARVYRNGNVVRNPTN